MTPKERFEGNYKLIFWYLRKHRPSRYQDEDYQQQASLALWRACISYDESKGIKFSTYAVRLIHSYICNLEKKYFKCTRVESYNLEDTVYSTSEEYTHLDQMESKEPSPEDRMISKDALDTTLGRVAEGTKDVIVKLMEGYSQSDIAEELGVSRQRIGQRIKRFRDEYQKYMSV